MKKIARLFAFVLLSLTLHTAHSQDFSNKGKDFWLAYPAHIDGNGSRMALYISSDVNTSGTVFLNNTSIPFVVTANQATVVQIFPTTYPVINSQDDAINIGKGIHVTSLAPIVLYAHILNAARSGSSLILPTNTLGREYIAASFKSSNNSGSGAPNGSPAGSQFTIVAVENNTTVEITPSVVNTTGSRSTAPFTITMNQGDVYQLRSSFNTDVTGSKIRSLSGAGSCKPIAVFSGSSWTSLDCANASGGDNLFQQLMPKSAWGKNYITAPFADRQYDIYRIIVSDPTTVVNLNGSNLSTGSLINGTYYQFSNSIPNVITTDKPVMVVQYMISQTCDTRNGATPTYPGDPEMIILNPIEQTINDVTVVSARANLTPPNTNITKHFFTIIMKSNATSTLRIDGNNPTGSFVSIGSSGYSYLHENVTVSTNANPSHRIKADSGFIALAYGMGNVESYGYNAGTNVKDLYQFVTIQNQYAQVDYPATCKGSPFNFSMTFPYQPTSIEWQFNGLFPNVSLTSPTPDSSWVVNGKTLYKYKLPSPYTIFNTGTYPIKVVAQNPTPDGCSGVQEILYDLVVLDRPAANFNFSTNGCTTAPVTFTDASTVTGSTITTWRWEFGEGGTASVKNPSYTYNAANSYQVKLSIITDVGCVSDTMTKPVSVTEAPLADFQMTATTCQNKPVTFTDASTSAGSPIVKWIWDFGDGSPIVTATTNASQTHNYTTANTYTATLKVETSSGCQSILKSRTFTVNPNLVASFTSGFACMPGGSMQFTNTTAVGATPPFSLASCSWSFSDGGSSTNCNPVHIFSSPGGYTATLTVTSDVGCTDDTTITLSQVHEQPEATLFVDKKKTCTGTFLLFQMGYNANGSSIQDFGIDYGDGSPIETFSWFGTKSHSYSLPGTYIVKAWVHSAQGCVSDTARDTILVYSPAVASFVIDPHRCASDTLYFTSNGTSGGANITSYKWTVNGNILSATGSSANYLPLTAGSYVVKLEIQTDASCPDDTTINVVVHPKPVPFFSLPNVCLPTGAATFTNSTTISDGSTATISYQWNFGDPAASGTNPNTSNQLNGTHFYSSTGSYPVKLTATSANGCVEDTIRNLTTVYEQPQAAFNTPAEVCLGAAVNYTDISTAPNNSIVQRQWNFDDGTTSTLQNPSKTFATAGTHSATLVVTSQAGCVSSALSKPVVINPLPTATFNISGTTCETKNINFVNQSLANAGNIVKWTWNMGVGNPDTIRTTGLPFNYVYPSAGAYQVTLQTETDKGCISPKLDTTINVYPQPMPGFAMSENCLVDPFSEFTDTSSIADGSEASFTYLWNFGDPNANASNPNTASGAVPAPKHKYIMVDTYNVSMTVTSNKGCVASVIQPFTINGSVPQASFTVQGSNHCSNDSLKFINQSFADVGTIGKLDIYWDWLGAPGTKETDEDPSIGKRYAHLYPEFFTPATKNYTIRVVAYSGDACLKDSIITVTIRATPEVSFGAITPVCANDPVFIINSGSALNAGVIGGAGIYSGNGITAGGSANPATAGAGTSTVRYTYTGSNGCSNFLEQPLTIYPVPTVTAGPDKLVLESGLDTLEGAGSGNSIIYQWTPNKWLSSYTIPRPKVTPLDDITYTLTVTSADGCSVSDNVFVKVLKAPTVPNVFTPNNDNINDTWEILYLETYPNATIEVYNRYGQLVFKSVNYTKAWDGKVNGKPVPVGTYYYIINPKNGRKQISGFVDIIR